ncbi:hypothetical protein H4W31_001340 [Plantactinospora soyae]|uniref:Uncharacterized protein n=1 Tax=Plantactinospora soyae TaxID=1544732 RepID=A0A927QWL6_9ACTN|nr:hypothetical protein [Plantactinospora soyae]
MSPRPTTITARLELTDSIRTATAEHLTYRVLNGGENA